MTVTFITLSCADACADVLAVARGGLEPYTYTWEDGSSSPSRRVCPTSDTSYAVTVHDAGVTSGEFTRPPAVATAPLTAKVLQCPTDAGVVVTPPFDGGPARDLVVPGLADEWLAGQPAGAKLADAQGGADVVPAASPVLVPVVAGTTLAFSVTGTTSNAPGICFATSADGGCIVPLSYPNPPTNGMSGLSAPLNSLIGVFLDDGPPSGTAPAAIDVPTTSTAASIAPLLRQVFFIGDGLTGTGSGAVQRFTVPPGATRLFLASNDGVGGNYNNTGQFAVAVSVIP
jgi:hypothetical protein